MKIILALTMSSLLLTACESTGKVNETIGETTNEIVNETIGDSVKKPSLSDISAVWDLTGTGEEALNEPLYLEITKNGEFIIYNYFDETWGVALTEVLGDNWSNILGKEAGCYYKINQMIEDLGNGAFAISEVDNGYSESNISLSDNHITFLDASETISYPKSSLKRSDFVPLCGDLYPNFDNILNSIL